MNVDVINANMMNMNLNANVNKPILNYIHHHLNNLTVPTCLIFISFFEVPAEQPLVAFILCSSTSFSVLSASITIHCSLIVNCERELNLSRSNWTAG